MQAIQAIRAIHQTSQTRILNAVLVLLLGGATALCAHASPTLVPRVKAVKSLDAALKPGADPATLIVKLADDTGARVRAGRLEVPRGAMVSKVASAEVRNVLDTVPGVAVRPLFTAPVAILDLMRTQGQNRSGEELADLTQYFVVRLPAADAERLAPGVLANLHALPQVENAYAQVGVTLPVMATPDFENNPPGQGYLAPAPAGIGVGTARELGFLGDNVTIADVEASWNLNHEEIFHLNTQTPAVSLVPQSDWGAATTADVDHGTATLGVLAAPVDGFGVSGIAPNATYHVSVITRSSDPFYLAPNAVVAATIALRPGDVMLLEVQMVSGLAFEMGDPEFHAVRQATALGIHVIEPAGNTPNGTDLNSIIDPPVTGIRKFDVNVRDSGAVMVGGGASALNMFNLHDRYVNSNHGARVNTYAWGQNVTTAGYGPRSTALLNCASAFDPFPIGNPNRLYTHCYNGTSAAGAIVAGAAAILEQKHEAVYGQPSGTRELRNLLELGTLSPAAIGHQPDLPYQLALLDEGVLTHRFEAELQTPADNFGTAVAGIGDVDFDGFADLAIGAPDFEALGSPINDHGRVYAYSGKTGRIFRTFDGTQAIQGLGRALADGDHDGDGLGDLAVSDRFGAVTVYSVFVNFTIRSVQGSSNEDFGAALALLRSIDAHPGDELIVGVPVCGLDDRVEIYSSLNGNLLRTLNNNPANCEDFGRAISTVPDVDGDGKEDLIVGAPDALRPSDSQRTGAVYVFSGASGNLIYRLVPPDPFVFPMKFGRAVAGGTVDGDNRGDIVVGAPDFSKAGGAANVGKVYLFSGKTGALVQSFEGVLRSRFGASVAVPGDWNGDGFVDLAAGQPNLNSFLAQVDDARVRILLGPFDGMPGTEHTFWTKDLKTDFAGVLASTGDVNGDGRPDLFLGERFGQFGGRTFVVSAGPAPDPFAGLARLVADQPSIEASDPDGDGNGGGPVTGGGFSPEKAVFTIDAGPAFAGAQYLVAGTPDPGTFLQSASGTLDAQGRTSAPVLGPFPSALLCGNAGFVFDMIAAVGRDDTGNGIPDVIVFTNNAPVEIINEFPMCP